MPVKILTHLLLRPLFIFIVLYGLLRLSMLIIYPDYFAGLSVMESLASFWLGMRFDFSIAAAVYALTLLGLLVLLFFPKIYPLGSKILLWVGFVLLSITWLLYAGSIGYFGQVHRHLGSELIQLSADYGFVFSLLHGSRLWALFAGVILLSATGFYWQKRIVNPTSSLQIPQQWISKLGVAVVLIAVEVIMVRGFVFTSKPIASPDAFALGDERQASLALNGAFSSLHSSRKALKSKTKAIAYFTSEEMQKKLAQEPIPSFQRVIPTYLAKNAQTPPNIVLILLESWSFKYIDGLAKSDYGATPFMDEIINHSAVWTNAYASGQRSIEGIQAILTSMPLIEGWPTIGFGLEQTRFTSIAEASEALGYETVFMQTSKARSFHVDAIAKGIGFNHYYAMEDYDHIIDYEDESDFGWDYEGLQFFAQRLLEIEENKPYFAFFFTGTTHEPFPDPGAEFHIRPHDEHWENRYLNTLRYADHSIESFIKQMQQDPSYANTVFIFMADHALRASTTSKADSFHIPLIVYSPNGVIPAGRHHEYVTQYDIMPTISALMGVKSQISTFGRSILTESAFQYAGVLSKQGNLAVWLKPNGFIAFDSESGSRVDSTANMDSTDNELRWNKLRLQQADILLRNNLWAVRPTEADIQSDIR